MRYERFRTVETVVAYLKEWRDNPYVPSCREAVFTAQFHETPGPGLDPPTEAVWC